MSKTLEHPAECDYCGQVMGRGEEADVWYSSFQQQWKAGHVDKACPPKKEKPVKQQNVRRDPAAYEAARSERFPHEVKCGNCHQRFEIPAHVPFPARHYHPRCNSGQGGDWLVGGSDPDAIEVGSATHRELVAAQRRERIPVSREDFMGPAPIGHEPEASDDIPF